MGILGGAIGSEAGSFLGSKLGKAIGGRAGKQAGANIGRVAGGLAGGSIMPFKKGGRVPGSRGKPKLILAHGGEYVLPVGVAPTKAQKAKVAKKKGRGKK